MPASTTIDRFDYSIASTITSTGVMTTGIQGANNKCEYLFDVQIQLFISIHIWPYSRSVSYFGKMQLLFAMPMRFLSTSKRISFPYILFAPRTPTEDESSM